MLCFKYMSAVSLSLSCCYLLCAKQQPSVYSVWPQSQIRPLCGHLCLEEELLGTTTSQPSVLQNLLVPGRLLDFRTFQVELLFRYFLLKTCVFSYFSQCCESFSSLYLQIAPEAALLWWCSHMQITAQTKSWQKHFHV